MKINHQKNLRIGRYSQQNQIYHITFTTINRSPIFKDFASARALINILKQSDQLKYTTTLSFVVMPDHIHWLIQLDGSQSLSNVVKIVKSKASVQLGHTIWQAGFYDHAIRKDEGIVNISR
jgi:putative transposase